MVPNLLLERVPSTRSTNEDLMDRWRNQSLTGPISRMADEQTKGKGRRGREWHAVPNLSLTFSIAYPFSKDHPQTFVQGLSLAVGCGVIQGLANYFTCDVKELYEQGIRLKWPNDILLHGRKLGGILIEGGRKQTNDPIWMIHGVGLNINPIPQTTAIEYATASLSELNFPNNALQAVDVWQSISLALLDTFATFDQQGLYPFISFWNTWNAHANQEIEILQEGAPPISGTCLGITQTGTLRVLSQNKEYAILHGDVSLRRSGSSNGN